MNDSDSPDFWCDRVTMRRTRYRMGMAVLVMTVSGLVVGVPRATREPIP